MPDHDWYSGRSSFGENLYLHEVIQKKDLRDIKKNKDNNFALVGYCCDEGVRRNQGRIGAKEGPNAIRLQLGKLANHLPKEVQLFDFGNLVCNDGNLEQFQEYFREAIIQLKRNGYRVIALGGGHDIAYAHYMALHNVFSPKKSIGIINLDAHLDLRIPNLECNSGTPFYQISTGVGADRFHYLPIGIQAAANHRNLLKKAEKLSSEPIYQSECTKGLSEQLTKKINKFLNEVDGVYLTIDLDGFSAAFAPGVSAPNPNGLIPSFCLEIINLLKDKIISFDIAEMNPKYDIDNLTSRLAAHLITGYLF